MFFNKIIAKIFSTLDLGTDEFSRMRAKNTNSKHCDLTQLLRQKEAIKIEKFFSIEFLFPYV